MRKIHNLSNKIFGDVLVLSKAGNYRTSGGHTKTLWNCKCKCGEIFKSETQNLMKLRTKNCGCRINTNMDSNLRSARRILKNYKTAARKKMREFSLTEEQFLMIISSKCFYCGSEPAKRSNPELSENFKANGIDRVDNALGYSYSNVVPCCSLCNRMKYDLSQSEFFDHLKKILNFGTKNGLG